MNWNEIYCGDNLNFLNQMVEEKITFNLILTDPPYNIGKDFGNNTDSLTQKNYYEGIDKRLSVLSELLTLNGSLLWFCSQLYLGKIQNIMDKYLSLRQLQIWRYENGMSRQTLEPITEYEPFWWYSKSDEYWIYNMDDVRVPYKTERVKNPVYKRNKNGEKVAWLPNPKGRKRGNIWEFPALAGKVFENERTEHPTQRPESLIIELIKAFCPKNQDGIYEGRILDPYMGSGTTMACCEKINKEGGNIKWVGIELEKRWVNIASERIKKEQDKKIEPDIFG